MHAGMFITAPESLSRCPESLLRSFRNAYHDHFGIVITMPRNPQAHNAYSFHCKCMGRQSWLGWVFFRSEASAGAVLIVPP